MNNYLPGMDFNHVTCDYSQAGRLAGEHLIGLGHRSIGLIHGAFEVQTTFDLRQGLEAGISGGGVRLLPSRVEDGFYTEEGGESASIKLIGRDPKITAILAENAKMAIGALSGLKSIGLRVPQDVSVMGCDDIHQAAFCEPALTMIHTPLFELGRQACLRLFDLIDGKINSVAEMFDVSLTRRGSTAAVRADR